ncbi:hypothetical protein BDV41DRAFT_519532 [Aspergillus transmontanensis]|uniref:Uncharacterized protein n=1 Tax=Aspergillus transmontanensis TaxID=1034304 RepID=A0A5N6WHK7_9EURO|nr:hypothetical protein BDV41DRAFT_519532 [Aspergillus transmontanensis]
MCICTGHLILRYRFMLADGEPSVVKTELNLDYSKYSRCFVDSTWSPEHHMA